VVAAPQNDLAMSYPISTFSFDEL